MTRARSIGAPLLLACFAALACESSGYSHVELYRVSGHPDAELGSGGLSVPDGGVLVFEAQPRANASAPEYEGLERFKLRPADPDVALAHRAILRDTWVVSGMSVGETRLHVIIDGEVVDDVPVEIFVPVGEDR